MFAVMDVLGLTGAALGLVLRPQTVLTPLAGLQHFSILGGFLRSSQKWASPGENLRPRQASSEVFCVPGNLLLVSSNSSLSIGLYRGVASSAP